MAFKKPRCNCPDAINKRAGDLSADSISLQIPSDWSDGFIGVKAIGGYCIHELAVLRIRKEIKTAFPDGIPSDYRTPGAVKIPKEETTYRLQDPPILGDDFS